MARCLAVAISQAPGLRGMPVAGHCSSAATSASCARSSARPTSRTMRVSPAISRADSMRQTASMARWVSVAATAADHTIAPRGASRVRSVSLASVPPAPASPRSPPPPSARLGEVGHLLHLAHLDDLVVAHRAALRPLDRPPPSTSPGSSSSRRALPWPRRTGRRSPWACRPRRDARAHRRRVQAVERQQHARPSAAPRCTSSSPATASASGTVPGFAVS